MTSIFFIDFKPQIIQIFIIVHGFRVFLITNIDKIVVFIYCKFRNTYVTRNNYFIKSFTQPSFLVNSGHCEEQSDVAILWLINVL